MQDHNDQEEIEQVQNKLTFFGEPIIKTKCQRNAMMSGIIGGVFGGLVGFLFTSSPKKSTRIGVGTYFLISVTYACYCAYDEIRTKKQVKLFKQAVYAAKSQRMSKDEVPDDVTMILENV